MTFSDNSVPFTYEAFKEESSLLSAEYTFEAQDHPRRTIVDILRAVLRNTILVLDNFHRGCKSRAVFATGVCAVDGSKCGYFEAVL